MRRSICPALHVRRVLAALAVAVPAAAAGLVAVADPAAAASASERRPDLVQRTPSNVGARAEGDRFVLGFDSGVENRAARPRPSRRG